MWNPPGKCNARLRRIRMSLQLGMYNGAGERAKIAREIKAGTMRPADEIPQAENYIEMEHM
jgi:hypothetical protein